ncbi:MAG: hypothetical protein ACHQ15_01465 [Candidatus Limnocylindrales bacterium]
MDHGNQRREFAAVVVTTDGRRVSMAPAALLGDGKVSLLDLLRSVGIGLLGLVGLIIGPRREPGGRRGERR